MRRTAMMIASALGCVALIALVGAAVLQLGSRSTDVVLLTRPTPITGSVAASAAGGGVLGVAKNHCVTTGGYYLIAPFGSQVSLDGRSIRLTGVGTFNIGQKLPVMGGVTSNPLPPRKVQPVYRRCGGGTYQAVWGFPPR